MSNKNKHNQTAPVSTPVEASPALPAPPAVETSTATTADTTTAPKATKEQLKALFAEYDKLATEHEKLVAAAIALKAKMSAATKAIFDAGGAGPFTFQGDELTVTKRGDTFFFRGKKKDRETINLD